MSRFLFVLSLIAAGVTAIIVTAMNTLDVDIELAFARVTSPLGLSLVFTFTLGLLAGLFWRLRWISQLLNERGRLRRALRVAEDQARQSSTG